LFPGSGKEIFLFAITSRSALGPTLPPRHWVLGIISLEGKWAGHKADHSPPDRAISPLPHILSWRGVPKPRDDFTFI
jgi:hypothetical protein